DFQENSNDKVDERSSEEYLRHLDVEYQERALLANLKRFIKRRNNFSCQKGNENIECYKCGNKGLVAEIVDWDEEEVSNGKEVTQVKVLMALADEELTVGKSHAPNSEWVDITIRKKKINEKWLTSLKKVSQCTSEQIPYQNKKVLGGELLIKSLSKININENAFIPTSMGYDQEMVLKTKDWVERLNLDNKLPNFNTERILVLESQAVNESLETLNTFKSSKDSKAEFLTPLPPLKNLQGASPSSEVMPLIFQPQFPKERPGLGIMKHTKPKTRDSSNKSASGIVTTKTKQITPLVPTEVKDTKQESKLNELTKIVHMLIDEKILKAKAKPLPPCTHYGFNDHIPNDCRNYHECEICRSYDHSTSGHNRVIHIKRGVLAESSQSNESLIRVKCNTYRSTVHSTSDHNKFDHFKREQPGHEVVFGDNSSCITEGYGSINCRVSTMSINHEKHTLVIVDEYSRYTWVYFLKKKSQTAKIIMFFIKMVENQNDVKVKQIKSDNETEFRNHELESVYEEKGISQNFSSPYTPEQNGVAERKNRTLIEAARTMLNGSVLSKHFWTEAVKIACYTQNRSIIVKRHDKTPYEIFRERIPGYSCVSKAFRVYNIRRQQIKETYHVTFDESMEAIKFTKTSVDEIGIDYSSRYPLNEFLHEHDPSRQYQVDSDISYYVIPYGRSLTELTQENHVPEVIVPNKHDVPLTEDIEDPLDLINTEGTHEQNSYILNQAFTSSHPAPWDRWSRDQHIKLVNIIGNPGEGMLSRSIAAKLIAASVSECLFVDFLSEIEPKEVSGPLKHPRWINAMQEELNQFYRNKVWTLVLLPYEKITIRSKWVFRNKKDKHSTTIKTKQDWLHKDDKGISICQEQYTKNLLKKYDISDSYTVKTPMVPPNNLGPDLAGKPSNQKESHLIVVKRILRKSTSGACQILGGKLVCWSAKKQQSVAMSLAEAKYVVVAGCCASILWMKIQFSDYDIHYKMVPIFCDNTNAITISNNPVLHSRTKHIDIRYHFIRNHILKGDIELHFIPTKYQLADIFNKPLDELTFTILKAELGMLNID
nr:retrovirus-related Pol polyprotein from transposon TNT 1-94 [Tanacetum cinerariifolium]